MAVPVTRSVPLELDYRVTPAPVLRGIASDLSDTPVVGMPLPACLRKYDCRGQLQRAACSPPLGPVDCEHDEFPKVLRGALPRHVAVFRAQNQARPTNQRPGIRGHAIRMSRGKKHHLVAGIAALAAGLCGLPAIGAAPAADGGDESHARRAVIVQYCFDCHIHFPAADLLVAQQPLKDHEAQFGDAAAFIRGAFYRLNLAYSPD